MTEVMDRMRRDLGPEAIIISSFDMDDGEVEVRAAIENAPAIRLVSETFDRPERRAAPMLQIGRAREQIEDLLTWHGVPQGFAQALSRAGLTLTHTDPMAILTAALEQTLHFAPIDPTQTGALVLVGQPGSGKTALAAKLAVRAAAYGVRPHLISADFSRPHAAAQLAGLAQMPVDAVRRASSLADLLSALQTPRSPREPVIVDMGPLNPFDDDDLALVSEVTIASDAEPILVMSAEGHPADQDDIADLFAGRGIKRMIVTKLDAVRRRGGAIAAAARARLALAHLGVTPFISGGLAPASAGRLARLLLDSKPDFTLARGVA